jgi:hypothetical protein
MDFIRQSSDVDELLPWLVQAAGMAQSDGLKTI